jgi:hypothetical protein
MAAEDLIPTLQTAVGSFNTTVDGKQTIINTKVSSGTTARNNAQTARNNAEAARDTAEQSLKAAYTDTQSAKSAVDYQDLAALAAEKAVTAVDVFVYDTSKDSDGGAWRKRCSKLSWYNEPLNTATRGSRREFPSVAVIVAEAAKVTIYDGDDPSLPMWMVFNTGTLNYIYQANISSVEMLNGRMTVGQNLTAGISITDFIADKNICSLGHASANYVIVTPISTRNGGERILTSDILIASGVVNDVAMTVLPDAPIDPATGLPVPTIAVATAGGVSVIKDDGTVVDIVDFYTSTPSVEFYLGGILFNARNGTGTLGRYAFYPSIPDSDLAHPISGLIALNEATVPALNTVGSTKVGDAIPLGSDFVVGDLSNTTSSGLSFVAYNPTSLAGSMVAYTTTTYNTGWMPGDIKGAFLADTDDTDLVATEYVVDGTFDSGSNWSLSNATIAGGVLSLDGSGGVNSYALDTNNGIVSGKFYEYSFDVVSVSAAGGGARMRVGSTGYTPLVFSTGTYSGIVVASGIDRIQVEGISGFTGTIDNVSVKLADADRSVNANGLTINGTVTRSPVATGSELVAYSGFSASNYLEQPYNSDLDFGTGDFCVMGWVNYNSGNQQNICVLQEPSTGYFYAILRTSLLKAEIRLNNNAATLIGGTTLSNSWHHIVGMRAGGVLQLYVDGKLDGSLASTHDVSHSSGVLNVGAWNYLGSPQGFSSPLSLLRISATAPTAEQIKKIYEDERHLFQENAACTLYGTSDAVTALAYDKDTDLLHVGTSSGRSVFKGLRRVDNTTVAVGTAISASNGLVVEE